MSGPRYATLGTRKLRLALWRQPGERFQDNYVPVDPRLQYLPNNRDSLIATPRSTFWQMNDWKDGEGFDRWDPERAGFYQSEDVRLNPDGDGLILGAYSIQRNVSGGSTLSDGKALGIAQGEMWTAKDDTAYKWLPGSLVWDTGIATGAGASHSCTSIADGDDTWIYSGHDVSLDIKRWKSGSNATWYDTSAASDPFVYPPLLVSWGGRLFALDGDDLYEIDKTTANTRTLVADLTGESDDYLTQEPWVWSRLSVSDKGPIWLQRLDNGHTYLWEYNVEADTASRIGQLPVDFAMPYSIYFTRGFYFVGYRDASKHTNPGDAYLYFQRGAQRGVLGTVRAVSGSSYSNPVLIGGTLGDRLVFYFDGVFWTYDLSDGGLVQLCHISSNSTESVNLQHCRVYAGWVFAAPIQYTGGFSFGVEIVHTSKGYYSINSGTGTFETGLYDMGYSDIPKRLLEVTVFTKPLPANTSVACAYTIDGTTYTSLSGSHNTDNASEKTWTVSTSTTTVIGRRFGIRLTFDTSTSASTPTVTGILVRATTAAHERQIVLRVDCSSDDEQKGDQIIADLQSMVANQAVVSLELPFEKRPGVTPETVDVEVRNVSLPDNESPTARMEAIVELAAVGLVTA